MTVRVLLVAEVCQTSEQLTDLLAGDAHVRRIGFTQLIGALGKVPREIRPDVALVDLRLPAGGAARATRRLAELHPALPVCILVASERDVVERSDELVGALEAGARGYLVAETGTADLGAGVRALAAGGAAVTPSLRAI